MKRQKRGATAVTIAAVAVGGLAIFIALPLAALLQRTSWRHLLSNATAPEVLSALRLSVVCSLSATVAAAFFGLPIAWLLARVEFKGRSIVRGLVTLPMVLPPVVGGVALILAFGRHGLAGQWLDRWFGIRLPFTTAGAILAEAFVALPFLVLSVEGALRSMNPAYEEAAATLGASRFKALRRVTIPMIAPALIAGATLAWARALGEFGATITFAGNLEHRTQTVPLAVYVALESNPGAAIALSLVLAAVSLVVLITLGRKALAGSGPFGIRSPG